MQYQTIVLEILQQRPQMHDQLRSKRMLLPELKRLANELRERHQVWKEIFLQSQPESNEDQVASAALELALKEMEESLPPGDSEPLSLDAAMAFLRRHTPPA